MSPGQGTARGLAWRLAGILACWVLLAPVGLDAARAGEFSGRVTAVADGDTIEVLAGRKVRRVRLYGVDCPEKDQAFGRKARTFTSQAVHGRTVRVVSVDRDRYGREVGLVTDGDGRLLNLELVRAGLAWVYVRYCHLPECGAWLEEEGRAREARTGLWTDPDPVAPWDFRQEEREGGGMAIPRRDLERLMRKTLRSLMSS